MSGSLEQFLYISSRVDLAIVRDSEFQNTSCHINIKQVARHFVLGTGTRAKIFVSSMTHSSSVKTLADE